MIDNKNNILETARQFTNPHAFVAMLNELHITGAERNREIADFFERKADTLQDNAANGYRETASKIRALGDQPITGENFIELL